MKYWLAAWHNDAPPPPPLHTHTERSNNYPADLTDGGVFGRVDGQTGIDKYGGRIVENRIDSCHETSNKIRI